MTAARSRSGQGRGFTGSPNSAANRSMPRPWRSRGARALRRPRRAAARRAGSRISAASASARARGSPGGTRTPVTPSSISSGSPAAGSRRRPALALRLHQHIGQAVAVAVARDPAASTNRSALAIGGEHLRLRPARRASRCGRQARAAPPAASSRRAARRRRYGRSASARSGGSSASAASRSSKPFFATGAADRQDDHGSRRIAAVAARRRRDRRRKAGEIEPVIGSVDASRRRRQRGEMSAPVRVQVTAQPASASFSRFSHSGMVQMSLACAETTSAGRASSRHSGRPRPACAGNARGAGRYRAAVRPPAPAPDRSGGRGSACGSRAQIVEPARRAAPVAGQPARAPPGREHAQRLVVADIPADRAPARGSAGGSDAARDRSGGAARRSDVEAAPLQRHDLLGDEGFGQARIALQDERDAARRAGRAAAALRSRDQCRPALARQRARPAGASQFAPAG